jgi:hypothetical protein
MKDSEGMILHMSRKLASIKNVNEMMPIEGRDKIALAMVDGWQVIVNKDQISIGDNVVYCEIDSVMPETDKFEFLRSKKFRIKTMKMAGVISQGICFPLSILPEGDYELNQDVTEVLGIKQYEETMDTERILSVDVTTKKKYPKFLMKFSWFRKLVLPKKQLKGFPDFISKTDETRIQNAPFYLNNKNEWVATEKVDGQSGTFFLKKEKGKGLFKKNTYDFGVCSRNLRIWNEDSSSYWTVAKRYSIKKVLQDNIGDNDYIAIQGECIAANVQGNKYKVTEPDLYVFNVLTQDGRMDSVEAKKWAESNGLKFVPIINEHYILPDSVKEVIEYAHGTSKLYDTLREGIVFRSKDGKQSFKAVDPLFLLKYDE